MGTRQRWLHLRSMEELFRNWKRENFKPYFIIIMTSFNVGYSDREAKCSPDYLFSVFSVKPHAFLGHFSLKRTLTWSQTYFIALRRDNLYLLFSPAMSCLKQTVCCMMFRSSVWLCMWTSAILSTNGLNLMLRPRISRLQKSRLRSYFATWKYSYPAFQTGLSVSATYPGEHAKCPQRKSNTVGGRLKNFHD